MSSSTFAAQTLHDAKIAIRTRQYSEAFQILSPLANSGEVDAQYLLASFYARGRGIEQDDKLCVYWLTQAAQQQHANAQYDLAALYERGRGVDKSLEIALSWYQRSAILGNKKARKKLTTLTSEISKETTEKASQLEQLYLAIRSNELSVIKRLLKQNIAINSVDEYAQTPLLMAIKKGHREAALLLIQNGANTNYGDQFGETALFQAVRSNYSGISQDLLVHGVDVNHKNVQGNTVLHMAVRSKNLDIIKILLKYAANPNIRNKNGDTGLDLTAKDNNGDIANLLKAKGGIYSHVNNSSDSTNSNPQLLVENLLLQTAIIDDGENPYTNWPPLNLAAWRGQSEVVEFLVKNSINIDSLDNQQHTPLSRATWQGNFKIIALLLAKGADPNHSLPNGLRVLDIAVENNYPEAVRMLFNADAVIKDRSDASEPLLILAARKGFELVALELINNGADIEQKHAGKTALMWSVQLGQRALFIKLLQADVNINVVDKSDNTALMLAVTGKHPEIVKILLGLQADNSRPDVEGNSPLAKASKLGFTDIANILLDNGVNVNAQNKFLNTPLMLAASEGHTSTVQVLLAANPDLAIRNKSSHTALMLAAQEGHLPVVEILLAQGDDIKRRNKDGKNAQQLARDNKHDTLAQYLQKYQQDRSILDIFN
jgi:ankyrin